MTVRRSLSPPTAIIAPTRLVAAIDDHDSPNAPVAAVLDVDTRNSPITADAAPQPFPPHSPRPSRSARRQRTSPSTDP